MRFTPGSESVSPTVTLEVESVGKARDEPAWSGIEVPGESPGKREKA